MVLATILLAALQPAAPLASPLPVRPVHAAPALCNPDAMKSIACNAQRQAPAQRRAAAPMPLACNPDPLKGAACHAHLAHARAEQRRADTRSRAAPGEALAAAD